MSSGPKPFDSWPHRGLGGGLWPCPHTTRVDQAWACPSWSPTPPHSALALHTNSPCVNVASIITDCHSSAEGRVARGLPQWARPGMVARPQNQAARTRVSAL